METFRFYFIWFFFFNVHYETNTQDTSRTIYL